MRFFVGAFHLSRLRVGHESGVCAQLDGVSPGLNPKMLGLAISDRWPDCGALQRRPSSRRARHDTERRRRCIRSGGQ